MTTIWTIAAIALLPPLLIAMLAAGRRPAGDRLVATELASSLGIFLLVGLTFAIDQASSINLAFALALLTLPATLLFAVFEERWL